MNPKVSVIIPCYNYADFLRLCLRSVLNQTFKDLEVIVIDDGSTDHTPEVVEEFRDPRLRYVRHKQNLGPAAAINTGLTLAVGEYVTIIGADDIMLPDNIAVKVEMLERCPNIGVVHSNAEFIDEAGCTFGLVHKLNRFSDKQGDIFKKLLYGNFIVASSVVVRRACYEKVGLYNPELRYAEDWDMWLRLAYHYKFGYINNPLIQHRLHRRNLRYQNFVEHKDLLSMEKIINKVFQEFDLARKGYSYQHIYWSNYFRMLNSKLGVIPVQEVLSLYVKGLRFYPRHLFDPKNVIFLVKIVAHAILPVIVLSNLRKLYRAYKLHYNKLYKHASG